MNAWHATGWLTARAEERVTPTGRVLARFRLHVRDRAGKEHVHLCEAQGGIGIQDVPLGVLQKWLRYFTPGRSMSVEGEAVRVPRFDKGGAIAGEFTVMLITGCEFHDRGAPGEAVAPSPAVAAATAGEAAGNSEELPADPPNAQEELGAVAPAGGKWPKAPSPLKQFLDKETQGNPKS